MVGLSEDIQNHDNKMVTLEFLQTSCYYILKTGRDRGSGTEKLLIFVPLFGKIFWALKFISNLVSTDTLLRGTNDVKKIILSEL